MVLAGLQFVNTAAWGHSKTDLITVSTGDTLTGAINNMAAGKPSLSTDYAGTISIKWRDIEQIETPLSCTRCDWMKGKGSSAVLSPGTSISPISSLFGHENASSWGQKVYSARSSVWPSKLRGLCASPRDGSEPHWPGFPASPQIAPNPYTDR